jgi:hypothetical protein
MLRSNLPSLAGINHVFNNSSEPNPQPISIAIHFIYYTVKNKIGYVFIFLLSRTFSNITCIHVFRK